MSIMTSKDADLLRLRIAELEREMMDFRTSMARVLSGLYETVHDLESWQRWNQTQEPHEVDRLKSMRDCIVDHFSMGEFKTMCFDLGISFDDLEGETITDLSRELVLLMNRLGRCPDVVLYCKEHRPGSRIML